MKNIHCHISHHRERTDQILHLSMVSCIKRIGYGIKIIKNLIILKNISILKLFLVFVLNVK